MNTLHSRITSLLSLLILIGGMILWACQKKQYADDEWESKIASSPEMEAYVVAGYELQAALNEFQKAINAIDWSQMHWTKDEDGHEVMPLPRQSLIFEERLNQFNEKRYFATKISSISFLFSRAV